VGVRSDDAEWKRDRYTNNHNRKFQIAKVTRASTGFATPVSHKEHEDHKELFDVGVHRTPTRKVVRTRTQTTPRSINGLCPRLTTFALPPMAAVKRLRDP